MTERIILLAAFGLLLAVAVVATQWWSRIRLRRLRASTPTSLWQALRAAPDGRPTIVTFSSPSCGVCRTTQAPAIDRLESTLGSHGVRILKVDVASDPAVADAFGVLTVPTTVILTPAGRVLTANNGFTPFPRLAEQVQAALIA